MAHAHLSNLNLKYLKFSQLLPGNCSIHLHCKKCSFLWSERIQSTRSGVSEAREGHTEPAAGASGTAGQRWLAGGPPLPAHRTLPPPSRRQPARCRRPAAKEPPRSPRLRFTGRGTNAEVKDTHTYMNFYIVLTVQLHTALGPHVIIDTYCVKHKADIGDSLFNVKALLKVPQNATLTHVFRCLVHTVLLCLHKRCRELGSGNIEQNIFKINHIGE